MKVKLFFFSVARRSRGRGRPRGVSMRGASISSESKPGENV